GSTYRHAYAPPASDRRRRASPSDIRRAVRRRSRCRGRTRPPRSSVARLLAAEVEQILSDAPDLHFLGTLGDAIAAVVAVDVFERQCTAVTDAAMHLHRPISRLAAQPVGPEVTDRDHVADLQRILAVHLPGGAEDEVAHQFVFGPELDQRKLN